MIQCVCRQEILKKNSSEFPSDLSPISQCRRSFECRSFERRSFEHRSVVIVVIHTFYFQQRLVISFQNEFLAH